MKSNRTHNRAAVQQGELHAQAHEGWNALPSVKRLVDEINARPAVERVNALATRHAYKSEMDEQAKKALFPHLQRVRS